MNQKQGDIKRRVAVLGVEDEVLLGVQVELGNTVTVGESSVLCHRSS